MPTFPVKDIPDDLWEQVKAKAAEDGHPIRWVALRLFEFYAKHGLPRVKP